MYENPKDKSFNNFIILTQYTFLTREKVRKGGATFNLTIFRGLAKIQEVTVLISDEWRMVIS